MILCTEAFQALGDKSSLNRLERNTLRVMQLETVTRQREDSFEGIELSIITLKYLLSVLFNQWVEWASLFVQCL